MKKKKYSRIIGSFIVMVLTFVTLIPASFAAEIDGYGNGNSSYALNYSGLYPGEITVDDNTVTLKDLPESKDYDYVMFCLYDEHDNTVYQDVESRNQNNSVSFKVPSNVSGSLFLRMSKSETRYGTYWSFINSIEVSVEHGDVHLVNPVAYERNLALKSEDNISVDAFNYYLKPSSDIQSDADEIVRLASSITAGLSDDYSKALAIHDWVCNSIYYDYDAFYKRTEHGDTSALGTLASKRSVCEGYSKLTAALLRAAGIPAKRVSGYALGISEGDSFPASALDGSGDTNHAWNEAYVDGRWIIIDATWDSDNRYEYGNYTSDKGCKSHRYFDIGLWLFSYNHVAISASNYKEMYLYVNHPYYYTDEGWKPLTSDGATPVIKDGRTLIPIRPVIEEMGGTVEWTPATERYLPRITCITKDYYAQMWPTHPKLVVNNVEYQFDTVPQVINGRTMIPLRILLEAMGCTVKWDPDVDGRDGRITIGYAG